MDIMEVLSKWGIVGNRILAFFTGGIVTEASSWNKMQALTYGVSVAVNAGAGETVQLAILDDVNFTIANPTNPPAAGYSQTLRFILTNESGDTSGTITWGAAYVHGTIAPLADGEAVIVDFAWTGVEWIQVATAVVVTL